MGVDGPQGPSFEGLSFNLEKFASREQYRHFDGVSLCRLYGAQSEVVFQIRDSTIVIEHLFLGHFSDVHKLLCLHNAHRNEESVIQYSSHGFSQ